MKKIALSVAALALSAGAAVAADLPSRKGPPVLPPPPPAPPMWTGFYAGLNAGYGFGTNSNTQAYSLAGNENWGDPIIGVRRGNPDLEDDVDASYPVYGLNPVFAPSGVGSALTSAFSHTQSGFIGGGQIGYNYQWGSNFVLGIEADIQGTGIRGTGHGIGVGSATYSSSASGLVGSESSEGIDTWTGVVSASSLGVTRVNAGVDWMGTVRGRLGYLFTPAMLLYATGGLTYGGAYASATNYAVNNVSSSQSFSTTEKSGNVFPGGFVGTEALSQTFVGGGNKSSTLVGWNVGGGLEWMFMPNWSLKAEAIYWNMGNMNVATYSVAAPSVSASDGTVGSVPSISVGNTRVNYQGVIARAGVNYHFNWFAPAPVVASY